MINRETRLYISASRTPGSFGATVFNELFRRRKINAVYLPRKFEEAGALASSLRHFEVAGCGVSHPLKREIISYLDDLHANARELNSVNTVVQKENKLVGFNTDWTGARKAIEAHCKPLSARILGAGAVVPAVIYALKQIGVQDIEIVCRDVKKAVGMGRITIFGEPSGETDILINAIPGAGKENEFLFRYISFSNCIFDLNVSPGATALIREARKQHKTCIEGHEMAVYQLIEQFRIYTGELVTPEEVFAIVRESYLTK